MNTAAGPVLIPDVAPASTGSPATLLAANINPRTGLATDYLNHFNEAVMLLEMIPDLPDCAEDFLHWEPRTYQAHFAAANFTGRQLAILAYEGADADVRREFDAITETMTSILVTVGDAIGRAGHDSTRVTLALQAVGWLKPLLTLAGGIINGTGAAEPDIDSIISG